MPNILTRSTAMPDDYNCTPEEVALARQACIEQRIALGFNPDPDCPPQQLVLKPMTSVRVLRMPLPANVLPVDERSALAIALDELVEEYGLAAVKLGVEQIEAANDGDVV